MRHWLTFAVTLALSSGVLASAAYAQKGMGETTGVARQAVKPAVVALSGEVLEVQTAPCGQTTGRAVLGTHFLLKTAEGKELNIHLGPTPVVAHIAKQLVVGRKVTVDGFRTEKMLENHYVAVSLTLDEALVRLRDENLRPLWARGGTAWRGRGGPQWSPGQGRGSGWGRSPGRGQGRGRGRGYSQERGRGYGGGPGPAARSPGAGLGRGWAADSINVE